MTHNHQELVLVQSSGIHNKGVFARRDIPKGTYIMEYIGKKITNEEADRISEKEVENGVVYLFGLDEKWTIDGDIPENDMKYVNHSCEPNAESINEDDHIWVVALRDIKQGEEIVYDYCLETEDHEDHPCKCGSIKCTGFIPKIKKK